MVRMRFLLFVTALLTCSVGCAGPRAGLDASAAAPVRASFAPGPFEGTWQGSYDQLSASLYEDGGDCILQIGPDGRFTMRLTRSKLGSNNLAKPASWSGSVIVTASRVTLVSPQGPRLTLRRSGNWLYSVAEDPVVEAPVAMSLQRVGRMG